jgi:hypothetical protein
MKAGILHKALIRSILCESYTNRELKDFVSLCCSLAAPFVSKRIVNSKWALSALSMSEEEVVSDCIADLFERDFSGHFIQIGNHFKRELADVEDCSDDMLLAILRRLIFARVNLTLLRLLRDADPILGKIIHNLDVALERSKSLEKIVRLGEPCIAPRNHDLLIECASLSQDDLENRFSKVVLVGDSFPTILNKVGAMLCDQQQFRRIIPFVPFALFLKKMFTLKTGVEQKAVEVIDDALEGEDIMRIVEDVCAEVRSDMHATYVETGKVTEEIYEKYMIALKNMLFQSDGDRLAGRESHYAYLLAQMPELTREEYDNRHRSIVEYLVRLAKQKLRTELQS